MRRLCATALTVLLCAHPLLAAGPLARSAEAAATRLAGEPGDSGGADDWKAVRLLAPRTAIIVTIGGRPLPATFVGLADQTITVMRNGATESISLDEIQMVEKRVRRGSALAAGLGAVGGLWLGSGFAYLASASCYQRCGGADALLWTAFIAAPIAAGYGAWRASSHLTEEVIYRRSPVAP